MCGARPGAGAQPQHAGCRKLGAGRHFEARKHIIRVVSGKALEMAQAGTVAVGVETK